VKVLFSVLNCFVTRIHFVNRGEQLMTVKRILAWITCFVLVFGSIGFERVALAQDPLVIDVSLPATVKVGESITASWRISGGKEPYILKDASWGIFERDEYAGSFEGSLYRDSSTLKPLFGTKGIFRISISDSDGGTKDVEQAFEITGSTPTPLVIVIELRPTDVKVGESITASWSRSISGGKEPYKVEGRFREGRVRRIVQGQP
jgi:hypothetical protein